MDHPTFIECCVRCGTPQGWNPREEDGHCPNTECPEYGLATRAALMRPYVETHHTLMRFAPTSETPPVGRGGNRDGAGEPAEAGRAAGEPQPIGWWLVTVAAIMAWDILGTAWRLPEAFIVGASIVVAVGGWLVREWHTKGRNA